MHNQHKEQGIAAAYKNIHVFLSIDYWQRATIFKVTREFIGKLYNGRIVLINVDLRICIKFIEKIKQPWNVVE